MWVVTALGLRPVWEALFGVLSGDTHVIKAKVVTALVRLCGLGRMTGKCGRG